MHVMHYFRTMVFKHVKTFVLLLAPLILLPIPMVAKTEAASCGYVIALMAIYWMVEPIPLPVTALLPVFLFPFLGILPAVKVSAAYFKDSNMLFIGGIIISLAVEHSNLHKRIALKVLLLIGTSPRKLMLGFMLTTMFLSMWVSNTATTAMMVPIVMAVVDQISAEDDPKGPSVIYSPSGNQSEFTTMTIVNVEENGTTKPNIVQNGNQLEVKECEQVKRIRKALLLAVAYSANVGGTGTLIGTGPNLVLKEMAETISNGQGNLNFATWMMFATPGMLLCVLVAWVWIQIMFFRGKKASGSQRSSSSIKQVIEKSYKELGQMTFHESAILVLFIILVFLWLFRDPQFVPGWSVYFKARYVKDSTVAVAIAFLLFCIPAKPSFFCNNKNDPESSKKPSPALLTWTIVQEKLPWGLVIFFGGGFAMSEATKASGLSSWLGDQLTVFRDLPVAVIVIVVSTLTAIITEITSNVVAASVMLPVLADLAITLQIHPFLLMIPTTVACSFAFMLPIATPPNAIVFSSGKMKTLEMLLPGIVMNIVCLGVLFLMINTVGVAVFDLNTFPDWAKTNATDMTSLTPNFTTESIFNSTASIIR